MTCIVDYLIVLFKVGTIDPGRFREIDDLLQTETRGKSHIEVLSFKETAEAGMLE